MTVSAPSPPLFGGRYQARSLWKEGGGIRTWLAIDRRSRAEVVVKSCDLQEVPPGARLRLEHEAAILRDVDSPWLTPLLDVGAAEGQLYLVLPRVPGRTLREHLAEGPLSLEEALRVGECLFSALQAAHAHGVLHRDIKPSNLIVEEERPLSRATLIDFGLARSPRLHESVRDVPVGTAFYTSPEQAGLLSRHEVGERSDLYSAGVVLFECLAGKPPFEGASVGEVLRRHLTAPPPELRSLGLSIPRSLDEILQRLLRKDPRERYQSAEAVVEDLGALRKALAAGSASEVVVGRREVRRTLTEPAFVGRKAELSRIQRCLARTERGRGEVVLVAGPSGQGKSRLLDEAAHLGAQRRWWVLRGRALHLSAPLPLQLLEGVAADIQRACSGDEALTRRLRGALGEQAEALGTALPALCQPLGIRPGPDRGAEAHGRVRALRALSALLDSLGTEERPAMVLLDDCQWADELSLQLLSRRAGGPRERPTFTLVLAAYRDDEVPPDHPHPTRVARSRLKLEPFKAEEIRALVESMAGAVPEEAHELVQRLSEANPFMAAETLRGMVEMGALVGGPGGWEIVPEAMEDVRSSRRAAVVLARRLELLAPATRRLLAIGAVLGRHFDLATAAALADPAPRELMGALEEARRRNLLWADPGGTRFRFIHDRVRETLLSSMEAGELRRLHLSAAEHYQASSSDRVFELAYHFDQAGEPSRALPYALAAARRARAQYALGLADRYYRIAARGMEQASRSVQRAVAEGLGDVAMLRGNYEEAARHLRKARGLAEDPLDRARIQGRLGELAFKQGDLDTASQRIQRALRLLGHRLPRGRTGFWIQALREGLVQLLHTLFPRLTGQGRLEAGGADLLAVRLYSRLAQVFFFCKGTLPSMWAHLRELNLAQRYSPTRELGQACSNHAIAMTAVSRYPRALRFAEQGLAIRRQLGDRWGEGQALSFYGVTLLYGGFCAEALERLEAAAELLERTGDLWELNRVRYNQAQCHYRLGNLAKAVEISRRLYRVGREIGEPLAAGALDVWAQATRGHIPAALLEAVGEEETGDLLLRVHLMKARALVLMEGQPEEAGRILAEAWELIRRHRLRTEDSAAVPGWLATALRRAAQIGDLPADRARELARRARRAAFQAVAFARHYPNNLPHALREAGLCEALHGRLKRARRLLGESLARAEALQARYEAARTRAARAGLGFHLGWPEARADRKEAEARLAKLRAPLQGDPSPAPTPVTLSLADRFSAIQEAGRTIASALTREAVFQALTQAGRTLLRAEACAVLRVGPDRSLSPTDSSSLEVSRALVERALDRGTVVTLDEDSPHDPSESALFYGVKSALCVPVSVRGRTAACLYAAHSQVAGLFGEDEERLAAFLATLAGAALENAEGFEEIQALSNTLRESRQALEDILSHMPVAILIMDEQFTIDYVNPAFRSLFGEGHGEVKGLSVCSVVPLGDSLRRILMSTTRKALRGEKPPPGEDVTEGRHIAYRIFAVPSKTPGGLARVGFALTDVTEQKRLIAQLAQSERLAGIGTLASGVAHEINNPLYAIQALAEAMQYEEDREKLRAHAAKIVKYSGSISRIVRDLSRYARASKDSEVSDVDVGECVREALQLLQHDRRYRGARVDLELEPVNPVRANQQELVQVCVNLIQNAIQATDGKGTVWVRSGMEKGRVFLQFRDTGPGIPQEQLKEIFDPFFTTKPPGEGTGLGLYLVHRIVERHGGTVRAESPPGAGALFTVEFPPASGGGEIDSAEIDLPLGPGST